MLPLNNNQSVRNNRSYPNVSSIYYQILRSSLLIKLIDIHHRRYIDKVTGVLSHSRNKRFDSRLEEQVTLEIGLGGAGLGLRKVAKRMAVLLRAIRIQAPTLCHTPAELLLLPVVSVQRNAYRVKSRGHEKASCAS